MQSKSFFALILCACGTRLFCVFCLTKRICNLAAESTGMTLFILGFLYKLYYNIYVIKRTTSKKNKLKYKKKLPEANYILMRKSHIGHEVYILIRDYTTNHSFFDNSQFE